MTDLPGVSGVLGARPTELPAPADVLGARPEERPLWTGPDADEFAAAAEPMGRVLRAFGQGAETAWEGGENLGFSDDVNAALKKAGIYPDVTKGQGGVLRAYNEALIRPVVAGTFGLAGAALRGISAVISGGQAGVAQAGVEVGAPGLGRELAALPEAFPLAGAETGGLHGVPVPERADLLGRELAGHLSAAEIDHAAELGVIGPGGSHEWMGTDYASIPLKATQDSITPTVQARVSTMQETAQRDAAAGAPAETPLAPTDIHEAARTIAPETFAAFDPLSAQVDALRGQIATAQADLVRNAEGQAPHAAEIADLQDRLQDATPRLAKKYEARLAGMLPAHDAFLADADKMALLTRDTPEIQAMREQLQRTDYQMRDLAPDVTAAYREAAKQFPETQAEAAEPGAAQPVLTPPGSAAPERLAPAAAPAAAPIAAEPVRTPAEGRMAAAAPSAQPEPAAAVLPTEAAASAAPARSAEPATPPIDIAQDVAAKLTAAGRPAGEAQATGEVAAAHYEARAARFEGDKGTAAELYRAEAPDIVAGRTVRAREPEMAQQATRGTIKRGKINLGDGRAVMTIMRDANASTAIHEFGHAWLEELLRDTTDDRAPADLVADGAAVRKWLGSSPDGNVTTAQHERFARGFERYMMEGTAPSARLGGVFAQFRQWLTAIYQTVQRLRAPMDDNIRGVFGRMLATPEERATIAPEREMTGHAAVPQPTTPYLRPGKEPTRLIAFLRRKTVQFPGTIHENTIPGGIRDPGGDLSAIIGGPKGMPGLINNATGRSYRDALVHAWEDGYFPEYPSGDYPPDDDRLLLDRIAEDHRGNPQYSEHDYDAVAAYHNALAHNAEVDRLAQEHGINTDGMTPQQFFDAVAEKLSTEEQAATIKASDASGEASFGELTAETKAWLEDHDIPWTEEAAYGTTRTIDDLENELGNEPVHDPLTAGEGEADTASPAAAGSHQGAGEEGDRPRGRVAGAAGRDSAEAAQGAADTNPAERTSPAAEARADQPGGPHAPIGEASSLVDKAGNIRLDNLNSDDDVKQVLRDLAAQNDNFMAARGGGPITDVQTRSMADAVGLTPENFTAQKPPGVSAPVWVAAVQKLTFQAADEVSRLGKVAGEGGFPPDIAAYLAAKRRLLMIADHFSTLTAEAGRTLRIFDKAGIKFTGDLVAMMERDTGKTLYQMQQEAKAVGALDTTAARSKMMQDMREPTRWQKFRAGVISYFINNLISGPVTHAAYGVGNAVTALFKAVPLTLAEATIDTARSAFGTVPADRVYFGEVGAQVYGMMHGAWAGLAPGWKAFKTGIATMEGADRLGAEISGNLGAGQDLIAGMSPAGETALRPQMIPGKVGRVLEAPSRMVQAIHTVSYAMNYEREIARRAFRAASNEGLVGDAFNTRVAEMTQNPPIGMVQGAHDDAMASVLMKRPAYGSTQQKFVSLINNSLPLKLAMPFMQIGMNILDEGLIKNTPLGLMSQTVRDNLFGRNGEVARTQQYARIMVGSGVSAGVMGMAAQGILTGAGPTDPRERALKEATGWKAYSIRMGDTYVPYRKYLGPLGPLVGGAASIYEVGHLLSEGEISKAAGAAVFGFAHVVADETWMAGLSELVNATTHWDTDGEKYLRNLALNFMPFSVGVGQVARMVDKDQREVHSWTGAARNKLPGLSESLMPQRDWTGTPIGSHTMMSPSVFYDDRTMAAMEAAEFYPAKIRRDVRGVPLTDQQYDDLARTAGRLAKMRMDTLVSTPGFLSLPAGLQRTQMQQVLSSSRKTGEDWLMLQPGNENIIRQATTAKSAQMQGALPEAVKAVRQGAPVQ